MIGTILARTALLTAVLVNGGPQAEQRRGDDASSRARAVVERAVASLGGQAALAQAGRLTLVGGGFFNDGAWYQGRTPDANAAVPFYESLVIDDRRALVGYESRYTRVDGTREWLRFLYRAQDRFQVTHLVDRFSIRQIDDRAAGKRRRLRRVVPHLLLAEALQTSAGLRDLGRRTLDGQSADAVSMPVEDGSALTIYFSEESGRLLAVEHLADMLLLGDAVVRWTFEGSVQVADLGAYPAGYRLEVEGRVLQRVTYTDISVGAPERSPVLVVPEDIKIRDVPPRTGNAPVRTPVVSEIAPGLYFVQGLRAGFNAMFAAFADYVVVFDAPGGWLELQEIPASNLAPGASNSSLSADLIALVKRTLPGRPIRYLVLSHFHSDHAAGLREFVAEGATILATATTRPVIDLAVSRRHTLGPDRLSTRPASPEVEIVADSKILEDASQRVELIELNDPHADGMLAAWFPTPGVLFVSDLFMAAPLDALPLASHGPIMRRFVDWLDRRKLAPARIYTAHGSGVATAEHLERVRSEAGAQERSRR